MQSDSVPAFPGSNGTSLGGIRLLTIGGLLCLALAGCGETKSNAQAAVVVNGEPLSAAELKLKLAQYDHFPPDRKASVTGTLLKSMVEMELLRQAAIADKLDADETVRAKIDNANRMILANAYLEKQGAAIGKPTEAEIKAYFDQHPELYSDRKIFELEELMVQVAPENAAEVKAKLGDGSQYKEFVAWLGQQKILSNVQPVSAASEHLRAEILDRLKNVKAGDVVVLEEKDQLSVIRVNAVNPQPVPFDQAKPMIEEKLTQQRRTDGINRILAQLREKAKIEYVAPYSERGSAPVQPK